MSFLQDDFGPRLIEETVPGEERDSDRRKSDSEASEEEHSSEEGAEGEAESAGGEEEESIAEDESEEIGDTTGESEEHDGTIGRLKANLVEHGAKMQDLNQSLDDESSESVLEDLVKVSSAQTRDLNQG